MRMAPAVQRLRPNTKTKTPLGGGLFIATATPIAPLLNPIGVTCFGAGSSSDHQVTPMGFKNNNVWV